MATAVRLTNLGFVRRTPRAGAMDGDRCEADAPWLRQVSGGREPMMNMKAPGGSLGIATADPPASAGGFLRKREVAQGHVRVVYCLCRWTCIVWTEQHCEG